jgi:hypothetical protein
MSIKEQVLEILKKNYVTFNNPNDSYTFFRAIDEDVIDKIQAIPDEVTLREVKELCDNSSRCKDCPIEEDCPVILPNEWDIDAITKAIRGSK